MRLVVAYPPTDLGLKIAELQLRSFPMKPWEEVDELIVFVNRGPTARKFSKLIHNLRPEWPHTVRVIEDRMRQERVHRWAPVLDDYIHESIGYKMMLPLWVEPPFLFMDGDVLVTRDPTRHFAEPGFWASKQGLDRWYQTGSMKRGTAEPSQFAKEVFDEFTIEIDRNHVCDACMYHVPKVRLDVYYAFLESFFQLPTVQKIHERREKAFHAFFQLDQNFLSTWLSSGWCNARFINGGSCSGEGKMMKDDLLWHCYSAATNWKKVHMHAKRLPNSTFWHYCVSGCKPEAIEKYTSWLDPSGEGFSPDRTTPWLSDLDQRTPQAA